MAQDPEIDYTKPAGLGYNTLEDAATAAQYDFSQYKDLGQRERAVILYRDKNSGKIYRTPQIGSKPDTPSKVALSDAFNGLANDQIPLAILHNHPNVPSQYKNKDLNNYLSDADTQLGKEGANLQRGPTGSLRMYLIPPNGTLNEGTGQTHRVGYQDPSSKQMATHEFQTVAGTLGQVPIDEIKQRLADKIIARNDLPPDYKMKILRPLLDIPQQAAQTGLMQQPLQ